MNYSIISWMQMTCWSVWSVIELSLLQDNCFSIKSVGSIWCVLLVNNPLSPLNNWKNTKTMNIIGQTLMTSIPKKRRRAVKMTMMMSVSLSVKSRGSCDPYYFIERLPTTVDVNDPYLTMLQFVHLFPLYSFRQPLTVTTEATQRHDQWFKRPTFSLNDKLF